MGWLYFINNKLSDIKGDLILNDISLDKLKKATEILVIDDNKFTFLDALRKNDYRIDYRTDIQSVNDVSEYNIILCDIRGVGKFLGSKYEGAYLAKQIKNKYPSKVVISYTADDYNPEYENFLQFADDIVQKGMALEDWDSKLSDLLRELADPVEQWKKTRNALLNADVSTILVAKYENEYVKAIKNKSFESFKKLFGDKRKVGSEIMMELTSSVLSKIITSF